MRTYQIKHLSCANCAKKIEDELNRVFPHEGIAISFVQKTLRSQGNVPKEELERVASSIEPFELYRDEEVHEEEGTGLLPRFFISLGLTLLSFFFLKGTPQILVFLIAYIIIGYDVLLRSAKNILKGEVFDENFLMSIATLGALLLGEYTEAVAVMLFYQLGEYFQDRAVDYSRKSIASAMDLRAEKVRVITEEGILLKHPEEVKVGDQLSILPGEKISLDGVILKGESSLDTSSMTGESLPRFVSSGSEVLGGFVNRESELVMEVTKVFSESSVAKILKLVQESSEHKAKTEKFMTVFARYYTPAVVGLAVLIAILPPLLLGEAFNSWIYRGLIFLVISCPCALVLSIPLAFFGGLGATSKAGVIVKGGEHLEALEKVKHLVFDKTGTLTEGRFKVTGIYPEGVTEEELLRLAATIEQKSNHPLARSILEAYGTPPEAPSLIRDHSGKGVQMGDVFLGNEKLLQEQGVQIPSFNRDGTHVFIARSGVYLGRIDFKDELKAKVKETLEELRGEGIKSMTLLTGDTTSTAETVAKELGLDHYRGELLPEEKVKEVMRMKAGFREPLSFIGDGTNDAPVLALSDVGIAMGEKGTDAAIEASDVLLMKDDLRGVLLGLRIAKFTKKILWQNIILALGTKIIVLVLGVLGYSNMWMAVFADVGVAILAVLNTLRILYKNYERKS